MPTVPIAIPTVGSFQSFSMIVDINGFAEIVRHAPAVWIARCIRDVLSACVDCIEDAGGEVVEVMGDAILGMLPDSRSTANACFAIARDLNERNGRQANGDGLAYRPYRMPSLKIGVEYGTLNVYELSSRVLGRHPLIIGEPINHASRILSAGSGNRCLIGPRARERGFGEYSLGGPFTIRGKLGEPDYDYFQLDLSGVWHEDVPNTGSLVQPRPALRRPERDRRQHRSISRFGSRAGALERRRLPLAEA
jgi:class 3 adenylate cyclase